MYQYYTPILLLENLIKKNTEIGKNTYLDNQYDFYYLESTVDHAGHENQLDYYFQRIF